MLSPLTIVTRENVPFVTCVCPLSTRAWQAAAAATAAVAPCSKIF